MISGLQIYSPISDTKLSVISSLIESALIRRESPIDRVQTRTHTYETALASVSIQGRTPRAQKVLREAEGPVLPFLAGQPDAVLRHAEPSSGHPDQFASSLPKTVTSKRLSARLIIIIKWSKRSLRKKARARAPLIPIAFASLAIDPRLMGIEKSALFVRGSNIRAINFS